MLRVTTVAIIDWLRKTVRPTVAGMKRGYIEIDAADLSAVVDGTHVGTVMGLKINRKAALDDDHKDYYDSDGNLIVTT